MTTKKKKDELEEITLVITPKNKVLRLSNAYPVQDGAKKFTRCLISNGKSASKKEDMEAGDKLYSIPIINEMAPLKVSLKVSDIQNLKDYQKTGKPLSKYPDDLKVLMFYAEHPHIQLEHPSRFCIDKGTNGTPLATMRIEEERVEYISDTLVDKINLANVFIGMHVDEKRDMLYAFGHNPEGMAEKDMIISMVGSSLNGFIYSNKDADGNYVFSNICNLDTVEKDMLVVVNKALQAKIIFKKEGSALYVSREGQPLGANIKEILARLSEQPQLYSDIEFQVKERMSGDLAVERTNM